MQDFLGIDLGNFDYQAWFNQAREFAMPRLGQTLLLLLAAVVVSLLARWTLRRIENRWIKKTETVLDDILVEMLRRIVQISVVFWAGWRIAQLWELAYLARIIGALWLVGVSIPASRAARELLRVLETAVVSRTDTRLDDTALPWINRIVSWGIIALGAVTALHRLDISITPLLAGASIMGVALSFAAKDTLSNLIAGVLLIVDRPFEVGDRIEIWGAPALQANWGDIVEIGIRATKIRTTDNIMVIIPNNEIMRRDIINYTASGASIRLRIPIGISYDSDVELAKRLAVQAANECEHVSADPPPVCILRAFGQSEVQFQLRVWLHDARRRRDADDWITERLKTLFDANGIEIPYPKRDLYIKQAPSDESAMVAPKEPDIV
jgi:small-conductance mechanosensitive channel